MRVKNLLAVIFLFGMLFAEFGITLNPTGTIEDEELESIRGIFYANGKIYIISPDISGYFVYNLETNDIDKKVYEELDGLRDIFVDERGYMYFTKTGSIWKRAPLLKKIRGYEEAYGIWKVGNLFYITDEKENRVVVMDDDGATLNFVGRKGEYNLMFDSPKGIFYDDGKLYVADYNNGRVQILYENLTLAGICGQYGDIKLESAYDVFVDADYVYVVDKKKNEIVWFTKDCYPVFSYAISDPVGVWVVGDKMYIAQENGKIQRFNYERMSPLQYIFLQVKEYMPSVSYYEKLYYIGKEINVSGEWNVLAYYNSVQAKYEENKPGEAYFYLKQLKSYNLTDEISKLENAISARILSLADGRWNENDIINAVRRKDFDTALQLLSTEPPSPPANISEEENITQPRQNITTIPKEAFAEIEKKISNPPPLADYSKAKEYYEKALEYKEKDPQLAYSYLQSASSLIEEENRKTSVYPLLALLIIVLAGFVFFFLHQRKKRWGY